MYGIFWMFFIEFDTIFFYTVLNLMNSFFFCLYGFKIVPHVIEHIFNMFIFSVIT